ncbi:MULTISPECIES: hypothetical protein [Micromonospora]|uniref:LigA protein n=1 Tax=Micromonospora solifontis TaxID=2487138 RepID=A0ABX9WE47_9ACTN|nr:MULTISPECIES: hypothetical protein [Micromonospora]NES14222.1 hypothetical protein [Micromonospora sp. PPF5-17B]NES37658.1 hypothetical protein [Micromonospora solifontis]NES55829.1 hypothetical protein [Micromonospora sp. PPF5-6]RNL98099.1 hypothetical protein EFE23_16090 [Micromonospora solifontis]
MTVTPQASGAASERTGLHVTYDGRRYPAEMLARGAAYELFSADEAPGFEFVPRPGMAYPWRRFVHATEVTAVHGAAEPAEDADPPLLMPVHRERGWAYLHQLSQQPAAAGDPTLAAVRASAVIRPGTRMVKVLSARQLAGYVRGWLPHGFCYREHDVAHLRTPAGMAVLRGDGDGGDVAYALRWRAADPADYDVPVGPAHQGLTVLPPRDRLGPPVLGTGFVPSTAQLIPEFVTRDFADLPLPANATLLAYPAEGVEVVLYTYQAEQRGWLRMVGPQWRHLLAAVPGLSPDQEYVPTGEAPRSTQLVGAYGGGEYEAVADLPGGFRVLAMTRAARYPVAAAARRVRFATWRGVPCLVLREESGWLRLRLRRPDPDAVLGTGAQCHERGVYETWAPGAEVTDDQMVDLPYPTA